MRTQVFLSKSIKMFRNLLGVVWGIMARRLLDLAWNGRTSPEASQGSLNHRTVTPNPLLAPSSKQKKTLSEQNCPEESRDKIAQGNYLILFNFRDLTIIQLKHSRFFLLVSVDHTCYPRHTCQLKQFLSSLGPSLLLHALY